MDEQTLNGLSALFQGVENKETPTEKTGSRCEILESLRPFLGQRRRALLERVIGLARLLELTRY